MEGLLQLWKFTVKTPFFSSIEFEPSVSDVLKWNCLITLFGSIWLIPGYKNPFINKRRLLSSCPFLKLVQFFFAAVFESQNWGRNYGRCWTMTEVIWIPRKSIFMMEKCTQRVNHSHLKIMEINKCYSVKIQWTEGFSQPLNHVFSTHLSFGKKLSQNYLLSKYQLVSSKL